MLPKWEDLRVYLFYDRKLDIGQSQLYWYRYRAIVDYFQDKELTKTNITLFFEYLIQKKQVKRSTCNIYLKLLKHICRLQKLDILDDFSYFKEDPVYIEQLLPEEIESLANIHIQYARQNQTVLLNNKYKAIIYTLAFTGMRIEELCNLKWADYTGKVFIIKKSKTNRIRYVPVVMKLQALLDELPHINEYIFGSSQGRMKPQTVNTELQKRAEAIHLKKRVHAHLFRHSLITQLIKENVSIAKIARIVGYEDLETTNNYIHLVTDDLIEAVESHPLLRKDRTLQYISNRIHQLLDQLVDKSSFVTKITENSNSFTIDIKKVYS